MRVAIVDEDAHRHSALPICLAIEHGCAVDIFSTTDELESALRESPRESFDVVVLDVMVAGSHGADSDYRYGGLTFARQLAQEVPLGTRPRIIFYTNAVGSDLWSRVMEVASSIGATAVSKSADLSTIIDAVVGDR